MARGGFGCRFKGQRVRARVMVRERVANKSRGVSKTRKTNHGQNKGTKDKPWTKQRDKGTRSVEVEQDQRGQRPGNTNTDARNQWRRYKSGEDKTREQDEAQEEGQSEGIRKGTRRGREHVKGEPGQDEG
jgi:hypothetical protein